MEELYKAILGKRNQNYYLTQFKQLENTDNELKTSWNWAAFFIGPFWALYRKMYLWFILLSIINYLTNVVSEGVSLPFIIFIILIQTVVFALYANALYLQNLQRKISQSASVSSSDSQLLKTLEKKGSVNMWVIYIFGSLLFLILLLLVP